VKTLEKIVVISYMSKEKVSLRSCKNVQIFVSDLCKLVLVAGTAYLLFINTVLPSVRAFGVLFRKQGTKRYFGTCCISAVR